MAFAEGLAYGADLEWEMLTGDAFWDFCVPLVGVIGWLEAVFNWRGWSGEFA